MNNKESRRTKITIIWNGMLKENTWSHITRPSQKYSHHGESQLLSRSNFNHPDQKTKLFCPHQENEKWLIPKILLEELVEGNRPRGRPEKKLFEVIRQFCVENSINNVAAAGHLTEKTGGVLKLLGSRPSQRPKFGGLL